MHNFNPRVQGTEIEEITTTNNNDIDIEMRAASTFSTAVSTAVDPYSLKRGLKTEDELRSLKKGKTKKQGNYYEKQNTLIEDLLRPLDQHVEDAKAERDANRLPVRTIRWLQA